MTNISPRPKARDRGSSSAEDYLEAILVLSQESGASVRITDLSERLGVSKPSVSAAVRRLVKEGYASHKRYGDVRLTPAGRKRAEEVASRHVLLHRFLADVLGVDEETAQTDACRLEHDLSHKTVQRLAAFVEFLVAGDRLDGEGDPGFQRTLANGEHDVWPVDGRWLFEPTVRRD